MGGIFLSFLKSQRAVAFSCIFAGLSSAALPAFAQTQPQGCFLDHHLFTLPHDRYQALITILSDVHTLERIAATWEFDSSGAKGFLFFSDGSYLEVWDASHEDSIFGYQEGCRLLTADEVLEKASQLHVEAADYRASFNLITTGRGGMAGDLDGGLFFIWDGAPERDMTKYGLQKVLKSVSDKAGQDSISDFALGGLNVDVSHDGKQISAIDRLGSARILILGENENLGMIAIKFTRPGTDSSQIPIWSNAQGTKKIFLDLAPGSGTMVIQSNLYSKYSNLLE